MRGTLRRNALLSAFAGDRSGNFAIITGLVVSVLGLAVGYGVNVAQLYNVRSQLVQSLDSALTSTGRDLSLGIITEDKADESIQAFLDANGGANLSQGYTFKLQPVRVNKAAKTISATAYVDVDAFFPLFGQANRTRVVTTAGTLYSDTTVEVAMMLDVTGSMREDGTRLDGKKQTKLQNLQEAAKGAVSNLLQRNAPGLPPRVKVALVPYSQGVNTGVLNYTNYVEGSLLGIKVPEAPLGLGELLEPVNALLSKVIGLLRSSKDNCTTERKVLNKKTNKIEIDLSDNGPNTAMVNRDARLGTEASKEAEKACPSAAVVPLTTKEADLVNAIDKFQAGGFTAGQIGIQWTRYLLSPKWGSQLEKASKGSTPAPYGKSVKKIAILMTDGEFNTAYVGVAGNDTNGQAAKSSDYATSLCSAMKAKGFDIEIFTIGFMLKNQGAAKETLKECASPDVDDVQHFYDASNGEELKAAFDAITKNTEALRLTN